MKNTKNLVYSLALSHITSKVVTLAAHYGLDNHIAHEGVPIITLAEKFNFNPEAFKRFVRILEAHELVRLENDSVYATELTPQLADARTPHLRLSCKAFDELEYSLQTNLPGWNKVFGSAFFPSLSVEERHEFVDWCQHSGEIWMQGLFSVIDFSSYKTVVDIAGGNGFFLAEILKRHPHQHGILFDQKIVIDAASATMREKGCLDRTTLVVGDFFKQVPTDGDVYMICRTLLNWNDDDAIKILNTCAACKPRHAKLLIIDFMLPEKDHPHYLRTAENNLNLLVIINSSHRTQQEWESLVNKSQLKLQKTIISDDNMQPEPFAPMIILECV